MFENVVGVKINQAKINRENFLPIWTPNFKVAVVFADATPSILIQNFAFSL